MSKRAAHMEIAHSLGSGCNVFLIVLSIVLKSICKFESCVKAV